MSTTLPITDRVTAIELPLPLEGLTSVNSYVLRGEREAVLVDPGWSSPETDRALRESLDDIGLSLGDISRILITHHHWDHYTQAIALQRTEGISVHLGQGEAPSIEAWQAMDGAFPLQVNLLERAGAPEMAREIGAIAIEPHERAMDFDMPAAWVGDGEEFDLGGLTVRALATPGHTRGHVCFAVIEEDLLLTGDHVLPRITPSIAFERKPDPDSLVNYLGSLKLVAALPTAQLLPAHGAIGGPAAGRAVELLEHHDERLAEILTHVSAGRSTSFEIARAMPWTRRQRNLGELELIHQMTAVLEVAAHLTVLERLGALTLSTSGDIDHAIVA